VREAGVPVTLDVPNDFSDRVAEMRELSSTRERSRDTSGSIVKSGIAISESGPIRVLIVESDSEMRTTLRSLLESEPDMEIVG
jgi:hypothetical protein